MKYIRPLSQTSFINDANLLAYWTLDGNANDYKNVYNGTSVNVVYDGQYGQFAQGGYFNGSSAYINMGENANLRLTSYYSFSFWIFKNTNSGAQRVINKDNANDWSGGYSIYLNNNYLYWSHNYNNVNANWDNIVIIPDGSWTYVACTYDGSYRRVYVNGVLVNSIATTSFITGEATNNLFLGTYGTTTPLGQYLSGYLDDVAIFNRALTAAEVSSIYAGESFINNRPLSQTRFSGDTSLVSYWKLDGNSNDSKGSNNGTDTAVSYGTQYGVFGQGANFNGSSTVINCGTNTSLKPSSVTVSLWFKTFGGGTVLVKKSHTNGGWEGYSFGIAGGGTLSSRVQLTSTPSFSDLNSPALGVNDGAWHHGVMTYTSGAHKLYLDGKLVASSSPSGSIYYAMDTYFIIGASYAGNGSGYEGFYNGSVDDVAIFSRVLGAAEVAELYEAEKIRPIYRPLSQTKYIDDPCLVSYWKFNGNGNDSKGIYNLTDSNVSYANAGFSQSASYNGATSISSVSGINYQISRDSTFSCWCKINSLAVGATCMLMSSNVASYSNYYKTIYVYNNSGTLQFGVAKFDGSFNPAFYTTMTISVGVWYHVVGIQTGRLIQLYVNGQLQGSATDTTTSIPSYDGFTVGGQTSQSRYFNGYIQDASVFNRALSAAEVLDLYQLQGRGVSAYTPKLGLYGTSLISDANLVAYWKLDGNSLDFKNTYNGTDTAMAYGQSMGCSGQGGVFNGTSSYIKSNTPIPTSYTISCWVLFNSTNTTGTFIAKDDVGSNRCLAIEQYYGDVTFYAWNASGTLYGVGSFKPSVGLWYHVCGIWNANISALLYVNGVLVNSVAVSGNAKEVGSVTFDFGRREYSSNYNYFNGSLDDISIFNRALTIAEIKDIYIKGVADPNLRPLESIPSLRYDSSLISYWKLDNNPNDSKGSNNGTATAITYGTGVNGNFGQAGIFNGSSSYVSIADSSSLKPSGAYSISHWIRCASTSAANYNMFTSFNTTPSGQGILTGIQANTGYFYLDNWSSGVEYYILDNVNVCDNQWHHLVGVYDGTGAAGAKIYVDGVLKKTSTSWATQTYNSSTNSVRIGCYMNNTTPTAIMNGSIDDVVIFNRALTAAEVQTLYTGKSYANNRPLADTRFLTDANLVSYWKLDGNSTDSKGTNNGTDTAITYGSQYGLFTQGAYFGGNSSFINLPALGTFTTISVSWWMKTSTITAQQVFAIGSFGGSNNANLDIVLNSTGYVQFGIYNGTSEPVIVGSKFIADGFWHHITITRSGANGYIYVDGQLDTSTSGLNTGNIVSILGGTNIGRHPNGNYVNGSLDDIAIFNRVLGAAEVSELYEIEKVRTIYRPLEQTRFRNDDSLVAYWKLVDNSNDSKGTNNCTDTAITYVTGGFNKVALLNGSTSKIQLPNSIINRGGSFSVWIKTSFANQGILGMQDVAPDNVSNWYISFLGITTTGAVRATWGWQSNETAITSTKLVNDNQWHHLVVTGDGLVTNLYIDGTSQGTFTASVATVYNTYMNLGVCRASNNWGYSGDKWFYFNGLMQDAALFARALSREEVAELYQSQTVGEIQPLNYKPQGGLYATSLINDANLVSYWKFDGSSKDSKGSNNGTDTAMAYGGVYGKFGQGAYFNGSSSYISYGSKVMPIGAKTISFWFKSSYTGNYQQFYDDSNCGSAAGSAILTNITTGIIRFYSRDSVGTRYDVGTTNNVCDGAWHHFTGTWDGTTNTGMVRLYIDGILVNTGTASSVETVAATYNSMIGRRNVDVMYYLNGNLDDFVIFNRVLSASEVFEIYSKGESSPTRPLDNVPALRQDGNLVSYWKLNGDAIDSKGSNNGTASNVTYSIGVNGRFGQCGVFNGSNGSISFTPSGLPLGASARTVAMWIKPNDVTLSRQVFQYGTLLTGQAFTIQINSSKFWIQANGVNASALSSTNLTNGVWTFICATVDALGNIKYYKDGVADGTATITLSTVNGTGYIGSGWDGYYSGSIDEVSVFSRVLTAGEVYQIYTQGRTLGYWKLNGNSTDYSGNNNNGTDTNIVYANGLFDRCAVFNGTNSQIYADNSTLFDIYGTMNFTYSLWINPNSLPTNGAVSHMRVVAIQESTNAATMDKGIMLFGDGSVGLYGYDGAIKYARSLPKVISVNNWYHVVGTYDGTNLNIYVNGMLHGTSACASTYNFTSPRLMMSQNDGNAQYYNGMVEELIFDSRAWSANEIIDYYGSKAKSFTNIQLPLTIPSGSLSLYLDSTNIASYPGSTVWNDLSPNKLVFNTTGTQTPYENKNGVNSFAFNSSGYWYCGTNYSLVDLAGDFTLIMWLYGEDVTVRKTIFEKAGTSYASYQQELAMTWEVDESMSYFSRYSPNYDSGGAPAGTMPINGWVMLGLKMSSGKSATARTAYWSKNASPWTYNYTSNSNTAVLAAGQIRIGSGYAGTMDNGNVAIVIAYNRMLSDAELLQVFNTTRGKFNM